MKAFQKIPPIEPFQNYLDIAFRQTNKRIEDVKRKQTGKHSMFRIKRLERVRLDITKEVLVKRINQILLAFPNISELPPFYQELVKATVDKDLLKKNLGTLNWTIGRINDIHRLFIKKVTAAETTPTIHDARKAFFGRISSILKQIDTTLQSLEKTRKLMRGYPVIKEEATVAIAGFPNVGKTTLLSKISSSTPEIAEYAFTTRRINMGQMRIGSQKFQLLDTPGTLGRDKMNNIELQAHLAIKYLAHTIVYIFDPTEPYPLKEQELLLEQLKKHKKPIILYMSKADVASKEDIKKVTDKHKKIISDPQELKRVLLSSLKQSS